MAVHRRAIRLSTPFAVRLSFIKACMEGFLFVFGVTVGAIALIWAVSTSGRKRRLKEVAAVVLMLPGLIMQLIWARTCWMVYKMLRKGRGGAFITCSYVMN